jgi:hypothetical protein
MLRRLFFLICLTAAAALAAGCDTQPDAIDARDYEGCFHASVDDICGDGPTVCRHVETLDNANLCTMTCEQSNDCEPLAGRDVRCVHTGADAVCLVTCDVDDDCPWTTACAFGDDAARGVCLPD